MPSSDRPRERWVPWPWRQTDDAGEAIAMLVTRLLIGYLILMGILALIF